LTGAFVGSVIGIPCNSPAIPGLKLSRVSRGFGRAFYPCNRSENRHFCRIIGKRYQDRFQDEEIQIARGDSAGDHSPEGVRGLNVIAVSPEWIVSSIERRELSRRFRSQFCPETAARNPDWPPAIALAGEHIEHKILGTPAEYLFECSSLELVGEGENPAQCLTQSFNLRGQPPHFLAPIGIQIFAPPENVS